MLKKLAGIAIIACVLVWALSVGGYTISSFKSAVHIKDFGSTMAPVTDWKPTPINDNTNNNTYTFDPNATLTSQNDNSRYSFDPNATIIPNNSNNTSNITNIDSSNTEIINNNSNNETSTEINSGTNINNLNDTEINSDDGINEISSDILINRIFIVTSNNQTQELSSDNTINFIKWLDTNYSDDISYSIEDTIVEVSTDTSIEDISTEKEKISTKNSDSSNITDIDSTVEKNIEIAIDSDILELNKSINIIEKLPEENNYDRTIFEKPIRSYTYNNQKLNRNDYAWKTSKYFNEKNFTYTCPYTGKIIHDLDDNKNDSDFGNLDFDHIVPLKSTYLRGAKDWSKDKCNAYAYDQSIGVDVLNSANRSKSDKGPTEWLPNVNRGSYCYSWLVICEKYDLSMTEEEINICNNEIMKARQKGEIVELLSNQSE